MRYLQTVVKMHKKVVKARCRKPRTGKHGECGLISPDLLHFPDKAPCSKSISMATYNIVIAHLSSLFRIHGNPTYHLDLAIQQQQQQQQSFYGPLSGTTRVSRYQKKHSPTHHPDHHPISFFHLLRSIASSLFKLPAWQSFCTTSLHVHFGLPLGLKPSASYSIHFFTQSVSSCHTIIIKNFSVLYTPFCSVPQGCVLFVMYITFLGTLMRAVK